MPKPFAAFDVDGTIFNSSLLDRVTDSCFEAGIIGEQAFDAIETERRNLAYNNTEEAYQTYIGNLVGTFMSSIAGVEVDRFQEVADHMVSEQMMRKRAFPRMVMDRVVDTHTIVAISGSPTFLVKPFLQDLPVDMVIGSTYQTADNRFTGQAQSVNKLKVIRAYERYGAFRSKDSIAIGDSTGDIPMLEVADRPVMFKPKQTLRLHGEKRQWPRVYEEGDDITVYQPGDEYSEYTAVDLDIFLHFLTKVDD